VFAKLPSAQVARAVKQLRDDLHTGAWTPRHRDLVDLPALDLGYYVVICELT
jgi:hypothetical protein